MEQSNQSVARDVFMYLLMIVVLGMSAVNFGSLVFQLINQGFPEVGEYVGYATQAMRFPLAALVVVIPVLVWLMRFLHRDVAAHPEKRELKIRKWLLYFTLFVAGLIVIGDLIGLIVGYLNGDLTVRFALKFATILIIAAAVFFYYLRELHGDTDGRASLVGKAMLVLTVAAVVCGFIQVGSPAAQRARDRDATRVNDLTNIQYQIVNFWTAKQRLPSTLTELEDPISGFRVPVDPETAVSYEYSRTEAREFSLCATFMTVSEATNTAPYRDPYAMMQGNWDHGIGRTCFDRTIDPQLYPPKTP